MKSACKSMYCTLYDTMITGLANNLPFATICTTLSCAIVAKLLHLCFLNTTLKTPSPQQYQPFSPNSIKCRILMWLTMPFILELLFVGCAPFSTRKEVNYMICSHILVSQPSSLHSVQLTPNGLTFTCSCLAPVQLLFLHNSNGEFRTL